MDDLAIWMATFPFNGCLDERPWVQFDERKPRVYGCFPISTKHYAGNAFAVGPGDPGFSDTGLTSLSFILHDHIYELHESDLRTRIGFLQGDLLKRFCEDAGL